MAGSTAWPGEQVLNGPLPLTWDGPALAQQRELDANAKAVEILQVVRGLGETEAFRLVYEAQWSLKRAVDVLPFGVRLGTQGPAWPSPI